MAQFVNYKRQEGAPPVVLNLAEIMINYYLTSQLTLQEFGIGVVGHKQYQAKSHFFMWHIPRGSFGSNNNCQDELNCLDIDGPVTSKQWNFRNFAKVGKKNFFWDLVILKNNFGT